MGLKSMSLLSGATVAATGGAALAFSDNGVSISSGLQLVVPSDTDFQTRRVVTAKVRPATLDAKTGEYGKDKKSLSLSKPIVLSTGRVVFNTIRVEREIHPSLSAAECLELNKLAAQMLVDTDCDGFWSTGSLS
jgi:hypothetical protein